MTTIEVLRSRVVRGLRNNNPFNIRFSGINWKGKLKEAKRDADFEEFENLVFGIRAGLINLKTYYNRHELKNLLTVVTRYAPSHENDTSAYVGFLASELKILPTMDLKLNERDNLINLGWAIVKYETGTDLGKQIFENAYDII